MKFIGRTQELATLEENYRRNAGFVVIYGRRRVGKTTLITEFIKNKPALYYLATEERETQNMQNFRQQLAAFIRKEYLQSAEINDWIALFTLFAEHNPAQKKILIIDEFQYLAEINPAFPSLLQKAWDETLSKHNIMVILCGSYTSMMKTHALSYVSPLYGRRTAQIRLQPLTFTELSAHYTDKPFAELVSLYAVTGGVPKYLEFFDNDADIFTNIKQHILNKNGYLYEEPIFLLEKEVNRPTTYFSILKAIAAGKTRLSELAAALEMKTTTLVPYLTTLIDLRLIERRVPVTEPAPEHSKKGRYHIQDSFLRFWFLFVSPNKSELEIGKSDAVLERIRPHFIDRFVSFVYEDVCRELFWDFCNSKKIPFEPSRVGSFWGRGNVEIDVVAIDHSGKKLFAGECKFYSGDRVVDMDVYADLQRKCQAPELAGYEIVYGLFSATGFDVRLRELAKQSPELYLIERKDIAE
ncbi:MAG TPA: ATP-binding protein [Methanocorpusculum sp.]|nr:ATP-binding protein [Methanocorpusculum sp.]